MTALALLSVVAGALGVVAMAALFGRLERERGPTAWPVAAAGVAMTAPITGSRLPGRSATLPALRLRSPCRR